MTDDDSITANFKHDIAFSFLDVDHALAKQIRELLSPDLTVFLYSEKQSELVATDGMETFSAAFRRDSRLVVMMARPGYGNTRWTRVEVEAIRSRAFEEGWGFLIVLLIEPGAESVPVWVPATHIWGDIVRLGPAGAAAVIERKLHELGKVVRPETAEDLLDRINRLRDQENEREQFLKSERGVKSAREELARLEELFRARAERLEIGVQRDGYGTISVSHRSRRISVAFQTQWANSLDGSTLFVRLHGRRVIGPIGQRRYEDSYIEKTMEFDKQSDLLGWRYDSGPNPRFFPTEDFAEHLLKSLLDAAATNSPGKL